MLNTNLIIVPKMPCIHLLNQLVNKRGCYPSASVDHRENKAKIPNLLEHRISEALL